jgi:hypothetical protein
MLFINQPNSQRLLLSSFHNACRRPGLVARELDAGWGGRADRGMTVPQEQFDAVAAAQAQAQAIAAKFEQQQAATGEAAPGGDDYGSNKRKFEDEGAGDLGAEDQMRKKSSFNGPEGGYNGVRPALALALQRGCC